MSRYALAGLLAIPALLGSVQSASAQCFTCMSYGNFIHQHGPLYNYSAAGCGAYGYGCGAGYGCYSGGNHAHMSRGWIGGGHGGLFGHGGGWGQGGGLFHGYGGGLFHKNDCNSCGRGGWGHYALSTFRNVFHRCHPCGRSGGWDQGYSSAGCSTCGTTATPAAAQPATLPTK